MRYPDVEMTGSVSQAASGGAATGSRTVLSGAASDLILAVTERQIAPGETTWFPFVARTAYGISSIHELNVISDNPNFNPERVRLGQSVGDSEGIPASGRSAPPSSRHDSGARPWRLTPHPKCPANVGKVTSAAIDIEAARMSSTSLAFSYRAPKEGL
jgi:hypothetical protein